MEKRIRTLSEILIDADNTTDLDKLKKLSTELVDNKDKYPHHQVVFGLEHILNIGLNIQAKIQLKAMFEE